MSSMARRGALDYRNSGHPRTSVMTQCRASDPEKRGTQYARRLVRKCGEAPRWRPLPAGRLAVIHVEGGAGPRARQPPRWRARSSSERRGTGGRRRIADLPASAINGNGDARRARTPTRSGRNRPTPADRRYSELEAHLRGRTQARCLLERGAAGDGPLPKSKTAPSQRGRVGGLVLRSSRAADDT